MNRRTIAKYYKDTIPDLEGQFRIYKLCGMRLYVYFNNSWFYRGRGYWAEQAMSRCIKMSKSDVFMELL